MTLRPLLEGFRLGLLTPLPEELEGHDLTQVTKCHVNAKPSISDLATRWCCSERTIYRMRSAGVDVEDAGAVALRLAALRSPSTAMVEAALEALSDIADRPF